MPIYNLGSEGSDASDHSTAIIGPELLLNGTFDTDLSNWTAGADWVWSTGNAYHSGLTSSTLTQSVTVVTGEVYQLEFELIGAATYTSFKLGSVDFYEEHNNIYFGAAGTYTRTVVATATGAVDLAIKGDSFFATRIDNVSLKHLSPATPAIEILDDLGLPAIDIRGDSTAHTTMVGLDAGAHLNADASDNTFVGYKTGEVSTTGINNTILGSEGALNNVQGNNLIVIGADAANTHSDGTTPLKRATDGIYIGQGCRGLNETDENAVVIGNGAISGGADSITIGNGTVGSGTTQIMLGNGTHTVTKLHGITNIVDTGQVQFPATQNPSTNVNTLDDYEEGTFSPVIKIGGSTTGTTYANQEGSYTKIGNLVHCDIWLEFDRGGALIGDVTIDDLPFTTAASPYGYATCSFSTVGVILTTGGGYVSGRTTANSTYIPLFHSKDDGTRTAITQGELFGTGVTILCSVSYRAAN